MSFRVAARRVPTLALARPTVAPRAAATSAATMRLYSDKPSPEARASSIIDSLPGNSLVSKTGWVTLGTGLTAVAISKEIYVANEETVILVGSLIFAVLVGRAITGPYKEWADSQIEKISKILNGARAKHTEAVQSRITSVESQKDVVGLTQALYSVAKETAQTEKEVFELRQKTALAAEVKSVLDSWVRFEASEREQEQRELAASVIKKVQDSLNDDKLQKQILDNAVAEIESLVKSKAI
ncbi:putative H+-transporting two-sector ATPase chain b precursor [Mycosarcoma maydis]|uniref:ATP synthase subunit 4 n=1 Tax=Mycosarcoma maydis TaxID=5270 RepID=A0A0D1BW64_MYCMD|nr:putative H+-transporting two-sector ATPase chain b precursor [Ustilago maydis 521]KIS66277.1 putative H+-transporting two-sector ATPase chain b precursor [Ustilago maydis 521]|eukprot:XP_011392148.1 putative H+-transporting two-sector ATPase chain b precursor [Ustilago maydis 521]